MNEVMKMKPEELFRAIVNYTKEELKRNPENTLKRLEVFGEKKDIILQACNYK